MEIRRRGSWQNAGGAAFFTDIASIAKMTGMPTLSRVISKQYIVLRR